MVTLKEIARECNVSIATVSKALNDLSDVSPATKEEIRKAARKMQKLPNRRIRLPLPSNLPRMNLRPFPAFRFITTPAAIRLRPQ